MFNLRARPVGSNLLLFSSLRFTSLDQWFPLTADHAHAERSKSCRVVRSNDRCCWEHGVVWRYVRRIFRRLLDRLHLLFAPYVVERTYHDRLPQEDVPS